MASHGTIADPLSTFGVNCKSKSQIISFGQKLASCVLMFPVFVLSSASRLFSVLSYKPYSHERAVNPLIQLPLKTANKYFPDFRNTFLSIMLNFVKVESNPLGFRAVR